MRKSFNLIGAFLSEKHIDDDLYRKKREIVQASAFW